MYSSRGMRMISLTEPRRPMVVTYTIMGRLGSISEIIRIPVLDYMVVFLLYGVYLLIAGVGKLFKRPLPASTTGTD